MYYGFSMYIFYGCIISQSNFWITFYASTYSTAFTLTYNVFDLIGSLLIIKLEVKVSPTVFANLYHTVLIIAFVVLVPMSFIQNYWLRYIVTLVPIACSGLATSLFNAILFACSTRINEQIAQAFSIGVSFSTLVTTSAEDAINVIFNDGMSNENATYNAISYYVLGIGITIISEIIWIWLKKNQKQAFEYKQLKNDPKLSDFLVVAQEQNTNKEVSTKKVFKTIASLAISQAIFVLFSYIVFPLFILHVPSNYCINQLQQVNNDWWILIILTEISICELLGSLLTYSKKLQKIFSVKVIIVIFILKTIIQLIFIPMSIPQAQISDNILVQQPLIMNDYFTLGMIAVHQLSTAVTGPMLYINFQKLFDDEDERAKGSLLLNAVMNTGSFVGGIASVCLIPIFS